jgi:succinyl-CoA synthetase beta subunit
LTLTSVDGFLIESKLSIESEFYAGITFDPRNSKPLLMISSQGGVEIEEVAKTNPEQVIKYNIDPANPPQFYVLMDLVVETGITGKKAVQIARLLVNLVKCYFQFEAITAEINPLIIDSNGAAIAADSKFEIDDSALFRVAEVKDFHRGEDEIEDPLEAAATEAGVSFVRLGEGNIGLLAGGAGVGMATMDMVFEYGGRPVNFLDLGGAATPKKTADALKIVLSAPGVEGVFVNVFGGINNCEEMAQGVSDVIDELNPKQTIVVKMRGHSQDEGWAILEAKNIPMIKLGTTEEGVTLLLDEMEKKGVKSRVNTCK